MLYCLQLCLLPLLSLFYLSVVYGSEGTRGIAEFEMYSGEEKSDGTEKGARNRESAGRVKGRNRIASSDVEAGYRTVLFRSRLPSQPCVLPYSSPPFPATPQPSQPVAVHSLNNNFRDMWGGFPPPYKSKDALLADYFPSAGGPLADSFFGKTRPVCFLFVSPSCSQVNLCLCLLTPFLMVYFVRLGYVQAWWNARGLKNVLLLHYNDAVKDLPDTVRRLAQFYEVDLTEELVQAIAYQASFASMKFNTATCFNYVLWGNPAFCNGTGTIIQDGKIFRSVGCIHS